jgi:citrate lyase subunit beta/citryl-CoA lyase
MFDKHISDIAKEILRSYKLTNIRIKIQEKGAIDYVIKARVECAVSQIAGKALTEAMPKRKQSRQDRPRRTRLYVPGNSPRMITSAGIYGSDCIIFDLEDSVAVTQKDAARFLIKHALKALDFGESELWVRITNEDFRRDLAQVLQGSPHGICIPKAESKKDIVQIDRVLEEYGSSAKLMPIIESAKGIVNISQIAKASRRTVALAFGAEDFLRDIGGKRSWETLLFPRSSLVTAANAVDLQALDTIFPDVRDFTSLREETVRIAEMGFDGKGAIHPGQIAVIHECFIPNKEEIEKAKKIIAAINAAKQKGLGVASLDGKMIDRPVEKRAWQILRLGGIK